MKTHESLFILHPPAQPNKGKEPILMGESDSPTDEKLSSRSSPLLTAHHSRTTQRLNPKKAPSPIQSIRQWHAPLGTKRGQQRQKPFGTGPQICAYLARGYGYSVSARASPIRGSLHPTFGFCFGFSGARGYVVLTLRPTYFKLRAPPCGFVMSSFSMYDGFTDLYDHILHFNQTMIRRAGNDCLLCKVFSASLKGPTLA